MLERRFQRGRAHVGELAQLLGAQGDFPAARRHEEAERRGGGVALVGGQLVHDVVEVPVDDRVRAALTSQRLQPQSVRPGGDLLVPEALHDELQVGGLDAVGTGCRRLAWAPSVAQVDAPAAHLLEHGVDERGLDFEPRRVPPAGAG